MYVWVAAADAMLCVMPARAPLSVHCTVKLWQGERRRSRRRCCCSLQVYSSWRALECVVLSGVHISSPPSQRRRKQRRPRFCKPWLQSLGCTGAPGVTGPLLEGIQLAKCRRSPVFNNNHLKSLQLACSYKEMESKKMWRGTEGGEGYTLTCSEPFECQLLFHMENSRGPLCSSIISYES